MRVGVIAEQLRQRVPGGIGTYVTGLLGGLVALGDPGLEVVAVTSRAPSPDPLAAIGVPIAASRHGHRTQMALWDAGLGDPKQALEILHLSSLAGPLRRSDAPARTVMVHDLAWRTHPELTTRRGARWHEVALSRALRSAAALITPSAEVAWALMDHGAASEPCGGDRRGLRPPPRPRSRRCRHGAGRQGRLWAVHPHGVDARAAQEPGPAHRRPRRRPSRRSSAGAPRDRGAGRVGHARGALDRAVLLGAQPGAVLAALYERCAAFAYVPITEGFGLPPLEAMAHGAVGGLQHHGPERARGSPASWLSSRLDVDDDRRRPSRRRSATRRTRQAAAGQARAFAGAHRWRDTARRPRRAVGGARGERGTRSAWTSAPSPSDQPARAATSSSWLGALARGQRPSLSLLARRGDAAGGRRWRPTARVVAVVPVARPLRLAYEQLRHAAAIARLGVDVHHGPHYTMPGRSPVPVVVTVHDLTFFDDPEWHERSKVVLFRRAIARAARRRRRARAASEPGHARTPRTGVRGGGRRSWWRPTGSTTSGSGRDGAGARGGPAPRCRPRAPAGGTRRVLVFVGTLEPRKGVLHAGRGLRARWPDAHPTSLLVLAGSGAGVSRRSSGGWRRPARSTGSCGPATCADDGIPALLRAGRGRGLSRRSTRGSGCRRSRRWPAGRRW